MTGKLYEDVFQNLGVFEEHLSSFLQILFILDELVCVPYLQIVLDCILRCLFPILDPLFKHTVIFAERSH